MSSSLGRAPVADLAFRVFDRAVHPDWFATRAHRRVVADGWQADIRIIDGGHAVIWRAGSIRLTEILGPATLAGPAEPVFASPVRDERSARLTPGSGVDYQASFEAEWVDPEVFTHLSDEMTLDAARDRLFVRGRGAGRFEPAAISHLAFESRPKGLLVHAFHSFPAERAVVRTQSLFEAPLALTGPRRARQPPD